ncbi:MAG: PIN domain-containing protein [Candidatus Aminicenantes bacterium]|nr:PIN domain-containing protein [Candidatus Aminicenantes bacterium]
MYLFDTDVLSTLAKKRRPENLTARLAATPAAAQFTTAISVAEISYGLFRLEERDGAGDSHGLLVFFETQVFPRLTILPFETEDAWVYGRLKASLERRGRPRFEPDLQIASIALRHRLTVVTANVRHFQGISGLRLENWLV